MAEDQDKALAWQEHKAALCPGGCGFPLAESTSDANLRSYVGDRVRCYACEARDQAKEVTAKHRGGSRHGWLHFVERR